MENSTIIFWIIIITLIVGVILFLGYIGSNESKKIDADCDLGFFNDRFCYKWTKTFVQKSTIVDIE